MSTTATIATISATELAERLRAGTAREVWNALTDAYFTGELIPGSRRVPVDQVGREVTRAGTAKDTPIIVYCSGPTCPNSRQAAEKLVAFGFTDVTLFEGGLEEWKSAGLPVERAG